MAVNSFHQEASKAQLDLTADSEEAHKLSKQIKKWDRKKKKMVTVNKDIKQKKILTEAGVWIPATYKTNRYEHWKEKTKVREEEDDDSEDDASRKNNMPERVVHTHWARHNKNIKEKVRRSELKSTDQILKARDAAEKKRNRNGKKKKNKRKR